MLEKLFRSKARVAILGLFFLNPGRGYHLREVARQLSLNTNEIARELANLVDVGILTKAKTGNAILYFLDRDFTFYKEFDSIIRKSAGIERMMAKALVPIQGIRTAFIFGSYAEGTMTPKSDIDIMIIGEPDMDGLNRIVDRLERKIGRPIQYIVYPLKELREKAGYGFVKNVMEKKKIFITGDADELG